MTPYWPLAKRLLIFKVLASYNLAELARRRDIFHYLDLNQSPQDTYIDALLTSAGHCYYGGLEALANEIDRGVSMPIDKDAANSEIKSNLNKSIGLAEDIKKDIKK